MYVIVVNIDSRFLLLLLFRDSIIFACVNSGTSFYGGFVIFSVLGFMAQKQGVEVKDVAKGGKKPFGS